MRFCDQVRKTFPPDLGSTVFLDGVRVKAGAGAPRVHRRGSKGAPAVSPCCLAVHCEKSTDRLVPMNEAYTGSPAALASPYSASAPTRPTSLQLFRQLCSTTATLNRFHLSARSHAPAPLPRSARFPDHHPATALLHARTAPQQGGADPRSPQHTPLTARPYLSAHCYPRSDSLPCSRDSARSCRNRPHRLPHRRATTATSRPVPPTERRTRWVTAAPPRSARGSSLAPSSSHTRATSPTTQRQRKARQK